MAMQNRRVYFSELTIRQQFAVLQMCPTLKSTGWVNFWAKFVEDGRLITMHERDAQKTTKLTATGSLFTNRTT